MSELLDESGGFVITGVMAAGKSTVADLLARRFANSTLDSDWPLTLQTNTGEMASLLSCKISI
jgi:shikimate kinase